MSESNSIYNVKGELIGKFKHGVAWDSPELNRLGSHNSDFIYDNDGNVVAKLNDGHVFNIVGEELGYVSGKDIFMGKSKVGSYIGLPESGAASIALIFNTNGVRGS